jgi:hypothetical protein
MDKPVIDKIEQLVNEKTLLDIGGQKFSPVQLKPIVFNPLVDTIVVHTLSGLCDFISNSIVTNEFVHIIDNKNVQFITPVFGADRKRESPVTAIIDSRLETFPFGTFLSQEEFAIRFRSQFERKDGDDSEYVLSFASSLVGGTTIGAEDDGITQVVQVKRGLSGAKKDEAASKPIVKLSPYRTFREITQPESEFLFRIRLDLNDAPKVALFEADGGKWIHAAIEGIAAFIAARLPAVRILA